jgi:hypothetical protein
MARHSPIAMSMGAWVALVAAAFSTEAMVDPAWRAIGAWTETSMPA